MWRLHGAARAKASIHFRKLHYECQPNVPSISSKKRETESLTISTPNSCLSDKMKTLNFITGNKNKLAEVLVILGSTVEVQNQAVDVPEIQGTIEDIATAKCRAAAEAVSDRLLCLLAVPKGVAAGCHLLPL